MKIRRPGSRTGKKAEKRKKGFVGGEINHGRENERESLVA